MELKKKKANFYGQPALEHLRPFTAEKMDTGGEQWHEHEAKSTIELCSHDLSLNDF